MGYGAYVAAQAQASNILILQTFLRFLRIEEKSEESRCWAYLGCLYQGKLSREVRTKWNEDKDLGQARSQGGGGGGGGGRPPPPGGQEGPFRRAQRAEKGRRDRAKRSFESLEVLRATRALSERPEGPMDVQRAPVQVRGPPG